MKIEEKKLVKKCNCDKKLCKGKCNCKKKVTTCIKVSYDVGWGNTLYIRGDGYELNWNKGIPLKYDEKKAYWFWECKGEKPVEFKLLINDEIWSTGDNFIIQPGKTKKIKPLFC